MALKLTQIMVLDTIRKFWLLTLNDWFGSIVAWIRQIYLPWRTRMFEFKLHVLWVEIMPRQRAFGCHAFGVKWSSLRTKWTFNWLPAVWAISSTDLEDAYHSYARISKWSSFPLGEDAGRSWPLSSQHSLLLRSEPFRCKGEGTAGTHGCAMIKDAAGQRMRQAKQCIDIEELSNHDKSLSRRLSSSTSNSTVRNRHTRQRPFGRS